MRAGTYFNGMLASMHLLAATLLKNRSSAEHPVFIVKHAEDVSLDNPLKALCDHTRDIAAWTVLNLPRNNIAPPYSEHEVESRCAQELVELGHGEREKMDAKSFLAQRKTRLQQ